MARSSCPSCGAPIDLAEDVESAEMVPLEVYTDASSDAPRYRFVGQAPLRVRRVSQRAAGDFVPDHRYDCPGHGNALG